MSRTRLLTPRWVEEQADRFGYPARLGPFSRPAAPQAPLPSLDGSKAHDPERIRLPLPDLLNDLSGIFSHWFVHFLWVRLV